MVREGSWLKTILLVEDNPIVMRNNTTMLKAKGAKVLSATNLAAARELLNEKIDVAIIDIMLPDGSGLSLLEEIRKSPDEISTLPILLLTAMGQTADIVKGLTLGADDYLSKPYDLNVLAARLNALLRRTRATTDNISIGNLHLDLIAHKATCKGKDLAMTQKEFAMLWVLVQNEGKTLPAKYLYEKVWKQVFDEKIHENQTRVHISNLKKKLADSEAEIAIETLWGEGYRLTAV